MRQYWWTALKTIDFVRSKRIEAEPNAGFLSQLRDYEWKLFFMKNINNKHLIRRQLYQCFPQTERSKMKKSIQYIIDYLEQPLSDFS